MNMLATIIPKSDQMNADDLIGRTLTIKITNVSLCGDEQPVALNYEGDGGKPYKPGKSMRRVLVNAWGPDGNAYVGRSMTLFRDEKIQFGGLAVGGIRISHMSDIKGPLTMALTATRGNRRAFIVKPLATQPVPHAPRELTHQTQTHDDDAIPDFDTPPPDKLAEAARRIKSKLDEATDGDSYNLVMQNQGISTYWDKIMAERPELAADLERHRQSVLDHIADADDGVGAVNEP